MLHAEPAPVRLPPHSGALELLVISSILVFDREVAGHFLDMFAAVCPPPFNRWFFRPEHQLIARAMENAWRSGHGSEAESICCELYRICSTEQMQLVRACVDKWAERQSVTVPPMGRGDMSNCQTASEPIFRDRIKRLRQIALTRRIHAELSAALDLLYQVDPRQGPGAKLDQLMRKLTELHIECGMDCHDC